MRFLSQFGGILAAVDGVGNSQVKRLSFEPFFLQPVVRLFYQQLLIPPEAGIQGHVCVEQLRVIEQRIHCQHAIQRMTDEGPVGSRGVLCINERKKFML